MLHQTRHTTLHVLTCLTAMMILLPKTAFVLAFLASVLDFVAARTAAARPMKSGDSRVACCGFAVGWHRRVFEAISTVNPAARETIMMKRRERKLPTECIIMESVELNA